MTTEEILEYKIAENKTKNLKSGPKTIGDREPEHTKVPASEPGKTDVAPKLDTGTKKTYEEVIDVAPKRSRTRDPTVKELIEQIRDRGDSRTLSTLHKLGKDALLQILNQKTTIETKRRAR